MNSTSSLSEPSSTGYWYDEDAAERVVNFIERFCSHVKGHTGPFLLEEWQKNDIIRPLFGWKRADGRRKFRQCYIEIPRKNGKSNLVAAIALQCALKLGGFVNIDNEYPVDKLAL